MRSLVASAFALALGLFTAGAVAAPALVPQTITLDGGKTVTLNLPRGFTAKPVAQGLRRARFFAQAPDGRIFVTGMHSLADNKKGVVNILDGFDAKTGAVKAVVPYLTGLRNPNSLTFYKDPGGQQWLYLALTDKLVRYKFKLGETAPTSTPEVLATFPDYGLSYKYGGWHLTRTVAIAPTGKVYVSVGSSCNACVEKEDVRATILEMNADGSGRRIYATGLRNAVDLKWVAGKLIATNQGADHLGDDKPEETMHEIREGADYGWPYCYQAGANVEADPKFPRESGCKAVPKAFATFGGHSSALGFERFDGETNDDPALKDSYLVALHGSSRVKLGHGYRIVRVRPGKPAEDFVTGFLDGETVNGRPCGIFRVAPNAFLFTDDKTGVIFLVAKATTPTTPAAP